MQLLIKWYGSRNAPGPQNFSPKQEWYLFLQTLCSLLGYDIDKLPLIKENKANHLIEMNSSGVISKKQKTNDSGSLEDWAFTLDSDVYEDTQSFASNVLGLTKFTKSKKENFSLDYTSNVGVFNTSSEFILFPYLPLVLFSLHLLYEELKLNCLMTESLPWLAQLLYQMSVDLRFDLYSHHYFLDYPKQCQRSGTSQLSEMDLQKLTPPNYMSTVPASIFETLNNLMNLEDVSSFPFLNQVNTKSKNIVQLFALIASEGRVENLDMEKFVKLIVPAGSRVDLQDPGAFIRDVPRKIEQPLAERIVLLYHEMGEI